MASVWSKDTCKLRAGEVVAASGAWRLRKTKSTTRRKTPSVSFCYRKRRSRSLFPLLLLLPLSWTYAPACLRLGVASIPATSNYRVCDPSQQVPIEAKYKTSAGADNQSTTKQTSADKQSSTPSSISNILPPSPSSFLHSIFILLLCFARVRQRSCRQLLPNTPGPGPSGWLAVGSWQLVALGGRRQGLQAERDAVDVFRVNFNVALVGV
jgi:hypothetical protein